MGFGNFNSQRYLILQLHPHLIPMDDSLSVVFTHRSNQACIERQFVLQSRGINSQIIATQDEFALVVDSRYENQALYEMTSYVDENIINAPKPETNEPAPLKFIPALLGYAWVLIVVSIVAGFSLLGADWYVQGRIDAGQISQGQWWRLVTALTLHANGQHLMSNMGFGLLFLYYSSRYLGYGLASLAMLLSGILGNVINVYMHGSTHYSIGASTAVFGVLGVLSAYVWKQRYFSQATWSKRLGPIFGGIALLAFTGTSGENTDIGAHLWGFVSGLLIGWLCAQYYGKIPLHKNIQTGYALTGLGLIIMSWMIAISN